MSSNIKIYKSSDAGAPVVYYSHIEETLNHCLVSGYNTQTATSVTTSNNIATFNCAGHGFMIGQCVLIAGATPSGLNGEAYVTASYQNYFTFDTTVTGNNTATGTITAKMAPAGWTLAATNYWQQGGGANRILYESSNVNNYIILNGAESYSAGPVNPFGTINQAISSVTTSLPRPWIIVANNTNIFMCVNASNSNGATDSCCFYFGDIKSYVSGDSYKTLIIGGSGTITSSMNRMHDICGINSTNTGHNICRNYLGNYAAGTAIGKHINMAIAKSTTNIGITGITYPNTITNWNNLANNEALISPVYIHEATQLRGALPGIWAPYHNRIFGHLESITGTGSLSNRRFLAINGYSSSQLLLEVSNTWDF